VFMSPSQVDRVLSHTVVGCNLISEFYALVFGPSVQRRCQDAWSV